jgi:lipooligosaccharide transport system ATP-binding protein
LKKLISVNNSFRERHPLPILKGNSLYKAYGSPSSVNGISFAVQTGECFGLLGPNEAVNTTSRMLESS